MIRIGERAEPWVTVLDPIGDLMEVLPGARRRPSTPSPALDEIVAIAWMRPPSHLGESR